MATGTTGGTRRCSSTSLPGLPQQLPAHVFAIPFRPEGIRLAEMQHKPSCSEGLAPVGISDWGRGFASPDERQGGRIERRRPTPQRRSVTAHRDRRTVDSRKSFPFCDSGIFNAIRCSRLLGPWLERSGALSGSRAAGAHGFSGRVRGRALGRAARFRRFARVEARMRSHGRWVPTPGNPASTDSSHCRRQEQPAQNDAYQIAATLCWLLATTPVKGPSAVASRAGMPNRAATSPRSGFPSAVEILTLLDCCSRRV